MLQTATGVNSSSSSRYSRSLFSTLLTNHCPKNSSSSISSRCLNIGSSSSPSSTTTCNRATSRGSPHFGRRISRRYLYSSNSNKNSGFVHPNPHFYFNFYFNRNSQSRLFSSVTEPTPQDQDPNKSLIESSFPLASHSLSKNNQERLQQLMPSHDPNGRKYTLYEKCVRRLYLTNLFHPVKMGLLNMQKLHSALGNPMDDPARNITIIHVAGTNGKGSVALKTARTLHNSGHKVGLFVSPHVSSFRERMQIDGELISQSQVEEYLPIIYGICEREEIPATFFEITTALAFRYFAENNVDAVVLETGLGGTLDATNVIENPDLCVITSIGLEHTRILGDTVELIAGEKAGIIKEGTPVLVGPNVPGNVIRDRAVEVGAEGYYTCEDVLGDGSGNNNKVVKNGVEYVDYDIENSRIVTAAIKLLQQKHTRPQNLKPITEEHVKDGISQRPPCRFEERTYTPPSPPDAKPIDVILDVAHNPPAMDLLVGKLKATYPDRRIRIVVGFSADKDLAKCGQSLLSLVDDGGSDASSIHLVEAAHPRAASIEEILQAEPRLNRSNFDQEDRSIGAQVRDALRMAQETNEENGEDDREEMVVVCGSVFLMAEAREALGIEEPKDSKYIAEVAGSGMRNWQENFGDKDPEPEVKVANS